LAGPLFNLGSLFRQLDESSVDVVELYHVLNAKPIVCEKPEAN
jgi:ABC-type multidrug transport system fused ATPase/permease subunit